MSVVVAAICPASLHLLPRNESLGRLDRMLVSGNERTNAREEPGSRFRILLVSEPSFVYFSLLGKPWAFVMRN